MPERFDEIRTERLLMRRWRDSDRAPFAELNGDAETMRFFPATIDRAASDGFVHRIEARFDLQGYGLWALELTATGEFIGYTGLNPMPEGVPGAGGMEVGWRLRKQVWHHGYATEAGAGRSGRGLQWRRSGRGLVDDRDTQRAVIAVMRRLGMSEHGFFEHPPFRSRARSGRTWSITSAARTGQVRPLTPRADARSRPSPRRRGRAAPPPSAPPRAAGPRRRRARRAAAPARR